MKGKIFFVFILSLFLISCEKAPSKREIEAEFEKINLNLKKYLGEDVSIKNFKIVSEGYINDNKNLYCVKYQFEIDTTINELIPKKINAELYFFYSEGEWICYNNSADVIGILVLQKVL